MDINEEKQKISYSHKLEVKRLILDKIFLGILIVLFGIFANIFIENYRAKLVFERFSLEKKLDSICKIRSAYSDMSSKIIYWTENKYSCLPKDYKKQCNILMNSCLKEINTESVMLSDEYNNQLRYICWIYQGLYSSGPDELKQYREFSSDINDYFDSLCKVELGLEKSNDEKQFSIKQVAWDEVETMGAVEFMRLNFNEWKTRKE